MEKAKRRSADVGIASAFDLKVRKVYGSHEHYEAFKRQIGIAPDQAANFERYGVLLQPKQMEFAVWARRCDLPDGPVEIGFGGAKGPGKSFASFAQIALDDCQRFPRLKVLYLRHTQKAAQEQLEDLVYHVLANFPDKEVKNERIDFGNGSRIVIGGFSDDRDALKYAGIEYDVLLIEELTQLLERTYKTLRLSVRSSKTLDGVAWRPRTYNTTNPLGRGHQWYKKRFIDPERRGEHVDRKFIFATVDDNQFVNREYVRTLDELTGAEHRAFKSGDWDVSAGAYFDQWSYDRHVIAPFDDLSWMRSIWCSLDYGFNHWNIIQLHAEDGDGVIYTVDELAHRKTHPEQIAADFHAWLARYGLTASDLHTFPAGSDVFNQTGAAPMSIAQQYRTLGISLFPAETSPGSRVAGAHEIARRLGNAERGIAPTWFVTQRCVRLIECLPYLERDPHNPEDVRKVDADDRGNGGDDPYDCLRYGLYRPRRSSIS